MECLKQTTLLVIDHIEVKDIPYELRFYIYFSKKYRNKSKKINDFLSQKVEV